MMARARVVAALVDAKAEEGSTISMGLARSLAGLPWVAFECSVLDLYAQGVVILEQGSAPCAVLADDGQEYAYIGLRTLQNLAQLSQDSRT